MALTIAALSALAAPLAMAQEKLDFQVQSANDDLADELRNSSLIVQTKAEENHSAQDLFAAARADYQRLLSVLYAKGRYSGVIRILIDGRDVAEIAPLDAPDRIGKITVFVDPGPQFRFSRARIDPLARRTELPPGFVTGAPAESDQISAAAAAAIDGWRAVGRAKATVADQSIVADHPNRTLAVDVTVDPGPKLAC
jgi:translocation and assembly module TamA